MYILYIYIIYIYIYISKSPVYHPPRFSRRTVTKPLKRLDVYINILAPQVLSDGQKFRHERDIPVPMYPTAITHGTDFVVPDERVRYPIPNPTSSAAVSMYGKPYRTHIAEHEVIGTCMPKSRTRSVVISSGWVTNGVEGDMYQV